MLKPIALFWKFEKTVFNEEWFFCQKKFWWKKIVGQKEFSMKNISVEKKWGLKFFFGQKKCCQKKFGKKKFK